MKVPLTPLRCLHRAIDLYGGKQAIVSGNDRFTYARFGERCQKLASALTRRGIMPGERIAYLSFNTHKLLEGYFGVPQARAVVMPLNVRLTAGELAVILRHSDASLLLYESDFTPVLEQLLKARPGLTAVNLDTEYEALLATGTPERADIGSYDEDSIAELFYTSGSTGTPKGVMLSHRTVYMHALAVAGSFNHDDNAAELHTIPLFHANGWGRPHTSTLMGLKQIMVRRFEPAAVCRLIQEEGATAMSLVPVMASALLNCPTLSTYDFSSLREIHLGGAASTPGLVARLEQAFHCNVWAGYGLTETSPVVSSARPKGNVRYADEDDRLRHMAMAGWPLPGTEMRVVDSAMRDVPRDMTAVGEIVIAGDNVMDGYFGDPEATAAVMSGEWFHSGDMAVWGEDGYVHIVDRRKDIIISGGENISSLEVEQCIGAHPDVLEVAVVSAPDPAWGEIPVAFVLPKPDSTLSENDLREFLNGRLAKFKSPRLYRFVDEPLPKGGTGKILKRQLREQFWEGKSTRVQG